MRSVVLAVVASSLIACGGDDSTGDDSSPGDEVDLATPENTWTWVPFEASACGNGTPAGIAINRTTTSDDLFVYFQGGGACWDDESCFGASPSAVHIGDTLTASLVLQETGVLADPRAPGNPLAGATVVYVPYCTGDVHAGNNIADYAGDRQLHHTGSANATLFVGALEAQFPDAAKVWVSGTSAGGYGSAMNFHKFANAWPNASVNLLADASPFVTPMANFSAWKDKWDMQYPPGCTGCETNFSNVVDTLATENPDSRIGFMFFNNDSTIRYFFSYASLVQPVNDLLDDHFTHTNTKAFVAAGEDHVMWSQIGTLTGPGGKTLASWVGEWLAGTPGWTTVRP